ncbi:hypothetical protein EV368DRAFT_36143, partial [Lentinula lateritia]
MSALANPAPTLNQPHLSLLKHLAAMIPENNIDPTEGKFFSMDINEEEVAEAKLHVFENNMNSALGSDNIAYHQIIDIPNENVAKFLNHCYRLIVLECCFSKLLAYIIDRRIRLFSEKENLLPNAQNGFRPTYRTTNNPLISWTMVDKARSQHKTLYFAYMDWTNAFPSTNRSMLWIKLSAMGVKGPMI